MRAPDDSLDVIAERTRCPGSESACGALLSSNDIRFRRRGRAGAAGAGEHLHRDRRRRAGGDRAARFHGMFVDRDDLVDADAWTSAVRAGGHESWKTSTSSPGRPPAGVWS